MRKPYSEPEPSLDPPEAIPLFHCEDTSGCGEPIYEGEEYYEIDGFKLCEEHGKEYINALYKRTASREESENGY